MEGDPGVVMFVQKCPTIIKRMSRMSEIYGVTALTLLWSILHIDLMACKFHKLSPFTEVKTTREYCSSGNRKYEGYNIVRDLGTSVRAVLH